MRQTLQKKSVFGINIFERTVSQKRKNTCMDQEGDGVRTPPPPQPLEITEFKYIIGLPWSPSQVSKQNASWEKIGPSPLSIFFFKPENLLMFWIHKSKQRQIFPLGFSNLTFNTFMLKAVRWVSTSVSSENS